MKTPERYNITAISRDSTNLPLADSNITTKTVDYDSFESLRDTFTGQDAVVNCVTGGATQYGPSKRIVDAAGAAGVKLYFANEFVGNIDREQYKRLPESFVGAKIRMRQYLEVLGKEGKITWTALNGGPFFDMCELISPWGA